MKKLRYSTGLKVTVAAIQQILFIVLISSILLVTTLFQKNILDFREINNKSFQSSAYFDSLFQKAVEEIFTFTELCNKFETDGSYDEKKPIDIRNYYSSQGRVGDTIVTLGQVDGKSRYYYLGELAEWARGFTMAEYEFVSGYQINEAGIVQRQTITRDGNVVFDTETEVQKLADMSEELQENVIAAIEYHYGGVNGAPYGENRTAGSDESVPQGTEDAAEQQEEWQTILPKVMSGRVYELQGGELMELLKQMDMEQAESQSSYHFINEEYSSIDGRGIWEDFVRGNCSESEMRSAYEELRYTLENLGQEVNTYKKCLNRYKLTKKGSNVSYRIEKAGKVYTNLEEEEIGDFTEYGKRQGGYFYYREADMRLETNIKGMEDFFYNTLEQQYGGRDSTIFLCVDTSFSHEDSFYEAKQEYTRMQPWVYSGMMAMMISAIGCFICFIYLSMVAGKTGNGEPPGICWFDKIPAELIFMGMSITVIAALLMYGAVADEFIRTGLLEMLIMSGVVSFVGMALFMLFYLSFVRRIRAGVLWNTSISYWIVHGIGTIFKTRKPATKMVIWFGVHLIGCVIIILFLLEMSEQWRLTGIACFIAMSLVEAILLIREGAQRNKVLEGIDNIASGDLEFKITTEDLTGDNRELAEAVNTIGDGLFHAVDASIKNERLKADLITNVSHDLKTPLTSIINYVDLLKREEIPNERAQNYLRVLEQKSQRLKQLTEDLLEASKISSGNITLQMERINFVELVYQTNGEFSEKFETKGLMAITKLPEEPVIIMADGRRIWRVLENLYNNVAKYAMANTRVYVDMEVKEEKVSFSIKNISQNALNFQAEELTERFIRGDVSRSTEGSGLGLSIAKNLTELMGGEFEIYLDGDLFRVTVIFKREPSERQTEKDRHKG